MSLLINVSLLNKTNSLFQTNIHMEQHWTISLMCMQISSFFISFFHLHFIHLADAFIQIILLKCI